MHLQLCSQSSPPWKGRISYCRQCQGRFNFRLMFPTQISILLSFHLVSLASPETNKPACNLSPRQNPLQDTRGLGSSVYECILLCTFFFFTLCGQGFILDRSHIFSSIPGTLLYLFLTSSLAWSLTKKKSLCRNYCCLFWSPLLLCRNYIVFFGLLFLLYKVVIKHLCVNFVYTYAFIFVGLLPKNVYLTS